MTDSGAGGPALDTVAAGLRFPAGGRELCTGWNEAMRAPEAESLPFLETGFVAREGAEAGLTPEMVSALSVFAARISADGNLLAFFRYGRHRMMNDPMFNEEWEDPWPRLDDALGADAGLINVLISLSGMPVMRENYRRLGIPDDVERDTAGDLRRWMENDTYFQRLGRWGITPWIVRWLARHREAKIVHLKRLHFSPKKFNGRLRAYRRRGSGEVVAISDAGLRFRADGNAWGKCCGENPGDWTSSVAETAEEVTGNPILPTGLARRSPVRLAKAEWDLVLAPDDAILGVHIPTGSPMTFDDCGESFRQAVEFYPKFFPAVMARGFDTTSWLYDPLLEGLLAPESNIVRTMREFHLYPWVSNSNASFFGRIFGWGVTDISGLPRRTSLEKAVGNFTDSGGHFHGGSFFLLNEDLDWGRQVYRAMAARLPA